MTQSPSHPVTNHQSPISPWPEPQITAPLRLDVLHQGEAKMAGLILQMHPALHGQREWAYYHAHSGTQRTDHYAQSWGIGIDRCVLAWLQQEHVFHIYINDTRRKVLKYTNADNLYRNAALATAGGRTRYWLKPEHWRTVANSRIPTRIPYVPPSRWLRLHEDEGEFIDEEAA